ncbi:MAG TPA: diguanylate cyclase [Thermoleophilaceae bacterium]|nr:diguanylate cyclase [Thermoleophilaceae bacterium]
MDPPLRERLGWKTSNDPAANVPGGRAAMARTAFWFALAGSALALLVLAPPQGPDIDVTGLVVVAVGSATLAAIALIGFDRIPLWCFHAGTVLATLLATVAIYSFGDQAPYGPLPYLWIAVYAFYFFPLPAALVHTAVLGALFGVELGLRDLDWTPIDSWVATIVTLSTAGLVVGVIRDRLTGMISRLTDAARTDPLTGLLNRRGFEEAFDVELERARRADRGLSVIVGDLDRFKELNDRFGHAAGDDVLCRVGETIRAMKRSWDVAARIGGEEFAIVAPDTDEHGAYVLAERLRVEIEETFEPPGAGQLTASFGIVSFPIHGQTGEALLQAADQALYAAKRLGRNRAVISSAEVPGILARAPHGRDEVHVELVTLLGLAEALDVRDSGSATHSQRVGRYAELIARELGLPPDAVERLRIAGILHDVGRVGVPDELLRKRGPLTADEWTWIRSHPAIGARMLDTTDFDDIGEWILAHHERPDGTGYPAGRTAGEVPLEASILAVADAYEAMTAARPYRPALDAATASEELRRGAGRQFDERVVEAILRVV